VFTIQTEAQGQKLKISGFNIFRGILQLEVALNQPYAPHAADPSLNIVIRERVDERSPLVPGGM
jgi:hypothetical protein